MALTMGHQVGAYAVVSATAYIDRDIIVQRFHPDQPRPPQSVLGFLGRSDRE